MCQMREGERERKRMRNGCWKWWVRGEGLLKAYLMSSCGDTAK